MPQNWCYRCHLLPLAQRVWRHESRPSPPAQGPRTAKLTSQQTGSRPVSGERDTERGSRGKLLSPSRRRKIVIHVCQKLKVSERRACQVLCQSRTTQRRELSPPSDEKQLTTDIIALATKYGRYGYRRITALLNSKGYGWRVNHKRVERIWRREGLKVPKKQPKRSRLWLNDGSCVRLRPERRDHVWSYDCKSSA